MIILGIETSCDETSAAVVKNGNVLSNIVYSQKIHKKYGGVVPNLASRNHEKIIYKTTKEAINDSKIIFNQIDGIAVTYGSGLLSSLIVGLNFAKGIALGLDIPLIAINHLEGHLASSLINNNLIKYPYLNLIVSGGHTQIWLVHSIDKYEVISNTVDDAAGEAFDKGARILGLEYPGGPEIEKLAFKGNYNKFKFPIPKVKKNNLDFSFSGLKTALLYKKKYLDTNNINYKLSNLAASYQETIIDTLLDKLEKAYKTNKINDISIVGGVSANNRFRIKVKKLKNKYNLNIHFPEKEYCTDNAAMIAMAGYLKLRDNNISHLEIMPNPNIIYRK